MIRDERASFVTQAIAPRIDLTTLEGRLVSFRTPDIIAVEEQLEDVRSPVYTGVRSKVYTSDQFWVVRESAAVVLAAIDASGSPISLGTVYVQDQKTTGTDGGTATSGSFQTRDLNVITSDPSGLASLASNQIDLVAGTYEVLVSAPAMEVQGFLTRLQNIDLASMEILGTTARSEGKHMTTSLIQGVFTIGVTTTLEVQMQVQATGSTTGFGQAKGFAGNPEVYTTCRFRRVA